MRMIKIGFILAVLMQTILIYVYIDLRYSHEKLINKGIKIYLGNVSLLERINKINNVTMDLESIDDF
ncbi:MAG: hypothetical protein ACRCZ9_02665 [Fusobacteriaceae bacterium]